MATSLRILLVEDNSRDEQLIREYATAHSEPSCEIEGCTTLDSALAYLTKRKFDIVLLDLPLPDRCGLDAVRKIIKHSPSIPIVVLTGADDGALGKQSIQLGAQDYLIKQTLTSDLLCRTIMYAIERNRIRQALRSSESRHRLMLESAPFSIGYFTPDGDTIALNHAAARGLGGEPDDFVGMNVADYFENATEGLRRIAKAAGSHESTTYEDVVDSQHGARHVVRSYVSLRDGANTVIGVQVMSSDITRQKNAELRFRLAADRASDLIYERNLTTKQMIWFGDIDAILGYPPNTIPHTVAGWESLVHPEDRARLRNSSLSHRTTTVPVHQEYRVKTADGEWRTWIDRASPMLDGRGVPTRWIGVCEDITSERMAASALDAESANLQSVMEAMPAFLYLQAPDYTISYANKNFHETFGDPKGRKCHQIFRAGNSPCASCATLDVLRTQQEIVREWTDDQGRVFELRERPFTSSDNKEHVLVIGTEITNLIHATQALRASELRFRELAGMLPEVVFECDLEGRLTYVNQIAFSRFNYTQEQFDEGLLIFDMMIPEDRERIRVNVKRLLRGGTEQGTQYTAIRSAGRTFPCIIHSSIISEDGSPKGLRGILIDISDQIDAQRAMSESEMRHRLLFENAPVGIGYFTVDGDIIALNRTAAQRLGRSPEDLVGVNVSEYSEDSAEALRRITRAASSYEAKTYEDLVPEGSESPTRWVLRSYTAMRDVDDAVVGVQVISSDITKQKNAELRFRLAANTTSDLICEWTVATDHLQWFGDIDDALGYDPGTIPQTIAGWVALIHPEDAQLFSRSVEKHRTWTQPISEEYRIRAADGSWRYWLDHGSPILDSHGKPVRWIGVCVDITARKSAEAALRTADDIIRSTPVGMFIYHYEDSDRLILVDANPEAKKLTDIPLTEWSGREFNEIWPNAQAAGLTDNCLAAYKNNTIYNTDDLLYEHRHVTRHYRVRAFRIPGNRLVVSFENITEHIEAQGRLQESETRYRNIVETSPTGILTVDSKGRIVTCNRAFLHMTGYREDELVGKHFTKIPAIHSKDISKYIRTFRSILIGKAPKAFEASWTTKDGRVRYGEVQVALMKTDGKAWSAQITVQDITDRKDAQDALRKSESEYRSLFENAVLGIYRTTPDGRILAANDALVRMLGYESFEQLAQRNLEQEGYEPQTPRTIFKQQMEETGRVIGLESSWTRRDGLTISVREHAYVVRDDAGNTAYYEGTLEDITDRMAAERQLRKSEATQRGILQASPVGIGLIQGGTIQWVSDRICEMSGYSAEELIGQSPAITAPSEQEYERIQREMAPELKRHGVAHTETQWVNKAGAVFDVDLRFASLDSTDPTAGGIFTILDISERKRIEQSLELMQFSMDSTDVIILWLRANGSIDFVNEAACRMLGYTREELMRKHAWDITSGYPKTRREELWTELKNGGVEVSETAIMRKDGTTFPAEMTAQFLSFQGTGYGFVFAVDITARKAAEAALQQSEVSYRAIFESANDGIILYEAVTGQLLDGNERIREMFGYPVDEFLKLPVSEYSSGEPQYSQEEVLRLIHAAATGVPQIFEWHCKKQSGELFWVEVSLRQVALLGESVILAIVRDISERKHFEAQLRQSQKLESIGTLASGVAHEINNPLMGMINYAELISSRVEDESLREFAEGIKTEGDRVAKIVRNLLSFSRQDQEQHSPARMRDIVDASLSLIGSLLRKGFIQLEIDIPDDLPVVRCRSQQIQQVFLNLVTNARDSLNTKYIDAHHDKRLRITSRVLHDGEQPWLRTTVEDFGKGIPQDLTDRIFDPFFTTKTRHEGTGLGLSISYGIVRDHGGRLTVESESDQFTRFHVDLPLEPDDIA